MVATAVHSITLEKVITAKGAVHSIVALIEQFEGPNSIEKDKLKEYHHYVHEFATKGYRSLGVAWKRGAEKWQVGGYCFYR